MVKNILVEINKGVWIKYIHILQIFLKVYTYLYRTIHMCVLKVFIYKMLVYCFIHVSTFEQLTSRENGI